MTLSKEQKHVLTAVKNGDNVFMTGPGGTGKSYLIKNICEMFPYKKVQVCALTGCAAELLGSKATTVHRWSGIGVGRGDKSMVVNRVMKKKNIKRNWRKTDVLIVDEVSMMSVKCFELLNLVGQAIRKNERPFGGIQLVFSGDFFQLPPVGEDSDKDTSKYCFESKLWNSVFQETVQLKKMYRQTDPLFSKIMKQVRKGGISKSTFEILKTRILNKANNKSLAYGKKLNPPQIFPKKDSVKSVNAMEMKKLTGESKIYTHKITCPANLSYIPETVIDYEISTLEKDMNGELTLELKIGSRVMCVANLCDKGLVNGSQGVVVDFEDDYPVVEFKNGSVHTIGLHSWASDNIEGVSIEQVPLILSWAITIHKAQGITLDSAIIDAGQNIFEDGQTYVALSRVKTLEGLFLGDFDHTKITADPKVVDYYSSL